MQLYLHTALRAWQSVTHLSLLLGWHNCSHEGLRVWSIDLDRCNTFFCVCYTFVSLVRMAQLLSWWLAGRETLMQLTSFWRKGAKLTWLTRLDIPALLCKSKAGQYCNQLDSLTCRKVKGENLVIHTLWNCYLIHDWPIKATPAALLLSFIAIIFIYCTQSLAAEQLLPSIDLDRCNTFFCVFYTFVSLVRMAKLLSWWLAVMVTLV